MAAQPVSPSQKRGRQDADAAPSDPESTMTLECVTPAGVNYTIKMDRDALLSEFKSNVATMLDTKAMIKAFLGGNELAWSADHSLMSSGVSDGSQVTLVVCRFTPSNKQELVDAVQPYVRNEASAGNEFGDISTWDVSLITDMSELFRGAWGFQGDLSSWDVSKVADMHGMFREAKSFNGDLSAWDVSSVTNMNGMFRSASSFNGDLSKWNVSRVTNMAGMFFHAWSFNGDVSQWNVSSVTNMGGMFCRAENFNCDLSTWNVSNATSMELIFNGASSFNLDLAPWLRR